MSAKGMTANPVKPARYRPGKAVAEDPSSEDESQPEDEQQAQQATSAQPPKPSSSLSGAAKVARGLKKVDLNERRRRAAAEEATRVEAEKIARVAQEEGFVTEESEDEKGSEEGSASESEKSSSEDETPKTLLRPTFLRKEERKDQATGIETEKDDGVWIKEDARRKAKADAIIQEQFERDAIARAIGNRDWDDDEIQEVDQVDDTDGFDLETERAAWKLRELKRIKREREAIEIAEKEREELERRRNLSREEREAEDKAFLDLQKEDQQGKGKMGYMQKYFHKGAYFQDDTKAEGLDRRDIMGSKIQDNIANRELLPQYMQIRDMTKLGRKGRTRYKDLKTEDTGRYGDFGTKGTRRADGTFDKRFISNRNFKGEERSGANTAPLGERRRPPEGAPEGPRGAGVRGESSNAPHDDRQGNRHEVRRRQNPSRRSYSSSRLSPRRKHRRRSYTYSRSPPFERDRYVEENHSKKRDVSPYADRYTSDKRRRVET